MPRSRAKSSRVAGCAASSAARVKRLSAERPSPRASARRAERPRSDAARSPTATVSVVERAELGAEPPRLLEVVRRDLRDLGDPVAQPHLEPLGEAQVQRGAAPLRGRAVDDVAHEQMAEARRRPAAERRLRLAHEILRAQPEERLLDPSRGSSPSATTPSWWNTSP